MMGVPVVVAGKTHYREHGFTHDPDSWVSYFKLLGHMLTNPAEYRLNKEQVQSAWQYAYRFFFDYPHPYPWHLTRMWDDYQVSPIETVLNGKGSDLYEKTFRYLVGDPIDWSKEELNGNER